MKELIHPPVASAIVNSLRSIGYSFNTALADIIDNSIAAGSTSVQVNFRLKPAPYVAIVDDGRGMTEETLLEAMRHGGSGPGKPRSPEDLGRYGLGLKTASLSQCRRLTLVTVIDGGVSAARWDLSDVEKRNEWVLHILSVEEAQQLPHVDEVINSRHGTVVLWEDFDRATAGEALPGEALEKLIDDSRDHLSLVFHRYLAPESGAPLQIAINGNKVEASDPFLTTNKRTELLPLERINVDGHTVDIQAYILPHLSNITDHEMRRAGGRDRLRQSQGFYVYRNRRLIIWGTWFRLLRQDELTKLARVRIDIPNALDHYWSLDVKKSTATPPDDVRRALRRIIERIADRGANVFRSRRRRSDAGETMHLWQRAKIRNATVYTVNLEHPSVCELRKFLDDVAERSLERLLKSLELGLPIDAIFADVAADKHAERPQDELLYGQLLELAEALVQSAGPDPASRSGLVNTLPVLDPFSMYPALTKRIVETLRDA